MKNKYSVLTTILIIILFVFSFAACTTNASLVLNNKAITIEIGETQILIATLNFSKDIIEWTSSNIEVVTVNSDGTITAKELGKATIIATAGKASDTCEVTVTEAITAAKANANNELDNYKNAGEYREAQKTELSNAIINGKIIINNELTIAGVTIALQNAKDKIDLIPTDAQLSAAELAAAKSNASNELDSYKNVDEYREDQKTELSNAIINGKLAINNELTILGISVALQNAKDAIDRIKTDTQLTEEEQEYLTAAEQEYLAAAKRWLILSTTISEDLILPASYNGVTITWTSDNINIISNNGAVNRPYSITDAKVTLRATLTIGSLKDTKSFTLTVPKMSWNGITVKTAPTVTALSDTTASFSGGILQLDYANTLQKVEIDIEISFIADYDLYNETATISYGSFTAIANLNVAALAKTAGELTDALMSANELILIKNGTYAINSSAQTTYVANKKIIIGQSQEGVIINITGSVSTQAALIFKNDILLKNVTINSADTAVPAIKVSTITLNPLLMINSAIFENVIISGGKGLNLHGIISTDLRNVKIDITNEIGCVALSIASSNVIITGSDIGNGTWGSIGLMYGSTSDYWASTLAIDTETIISSFVYIENYEIQKAELAERGIEEIVTGLDHWQSAFAPGTTTFVYYDLTT